MLNYASNTFWIVTGVILLATVVLGPLVAAQAAALTSFTTFSDLMIGAFAILAGRTAQLSGDPIDPAHRSIAKPFIRQATDLVFRGADASLNPIDLGLLNSLNSLASNQAQIVAYMQALNTSINRAQGAALAQDSESEVMQLTAARGYAARLGELMTEDSALRLNAATSLEERGFAATLQGDAAVAARQQVVLGDS